MFHRRGWMRCSPGSASGSEARVRISADFNGIDGHAGAGLSVALDTFETLRSLANAQLRLREGVRLIIFDWSDDQEERTRVR